MPVAIVTGSAGLIGSEAVKRFIAEGYTVVGVDNNMRRSFFGDEASTAPTTRALVETYGDRGQYIPNYVDIRNRLTIESLFKKYVPDVVVHCAAQPSHDWAVKDPHTDFGINAVGTLNLLDAARKFSPKATFVHASTSKIYGDNPNRLPLKKYMFWDGTEESLENADVTRFDLPVGHQYHNGIDTTMSIDNCLHSLFGASKASGDLLVQEYGRYFGMKTVCFRPGCLTGADHAGTELHGFLAYLMKCCVEGKPYRVFGYDRLQVRCNIHAIDLVDAFVHFVNGDAAPGSVYNIGGGRENAVSMREAIKLCEKISGRQLKLSYVPEARIGDHKWWISDNSAFKRDHPGWAGPVHSIDWILTEIANKWA